MASLAVAVALKLIATQNAADVFTDARLAFPISYANAQAAMFLVAFWPAIALAARRSIPSVLRALSCGAATALLAGWLLTQSKGGGVGLLVSTIAFFAVSPERLRSVLPTVIAGGTAAAGFYRLTEPYRAAETDYLSAIHGAGWALLWLSGIAALAGLAYALIDRRVSVGARTRRAGAVVVVAALVGSLAAGALLFVSRVDSPTHSLHKRWSALLQPPGRETGTSHFTSLGSNRADFWRVSLHQFPEHPIVGVGARGFWTVYLQHRRSDEMPIRGHSLELDTLLEEGLVGLALLLTGVGTLLALCLRHRWRPVSAAAFAGGIYWFAHSAVDWNWNIPAATIPVFVLLGIGAAPGGAGGYVKRRPALVAAALVAAVAVLVFIPVWLSGKLTREAFLDPARARPDLRLAKRLDPLSPDPYVMQAKLDPDPAVRLRALQRAVELQPERFDFHFDLGNAYRAAGRAAEARRQYGVAARLDPRNARFYNSLARSAR
jgi:O-antigen ligase